MLSCSLEWDRKARFSSCFRDPCTRKWFLWKLWYRFWDHRIGNVGLSCDTWEVILFRLALSCLVGNSGWLFIFCPISLILIFIFYRLSSQVCLSMSSSFYPSLDLSCKAIPLLHPIPRNLSCSSPHASQYLSSIIFSACSIFSTLPRINQNIHSRLQLLSLPSEWNRPLTPSAFTSIYRHFYFFVGSSQSPGRNPSHRSLILVRNRDASCDFHVSSHAFQVSSAFISFRLAYLLLVLFPSLTRCHDFPFPTSRAWV